MIPPLLALPSLCASASEAAPLLQRTDLFISGQDSVNIYRIPSLLVAPSGAILAFCEAREGDDGDPTDLVLKRSLFEDPPRPTAMLNGYPRTFGYGVTWEPMRPVLRGEGEAIMNPTPVFDRGADSIVLLCYKALGGLQRHLQHPFEGPVLLLSSADEGLNWSAPRDIKPSVGDFIPGPGVGIQLQSGRLVIPGYGPDAKGATFSRVIYSDNHGLTWHAGAPVASPSDESQVVELTPGTVMLNARSNVGHGCRYVAISHDGGQTWTTEGDEPGLPEPCCQASLVGYDVTEAAGTQRSLMFSNPASPGPWVDRTKLTVRVSQDLGQSWAVSRLLEPGPAAYSCLAPLRDGTFGLLYETGETHPYERIAFARFNMEWLTAGSQ